MHKAIALASLFSVLSLIIACSNKESESFRIGTNTWPGYEPLYLAQAQGYLDNSAVKLLEMLSATEVLHAMRSGNLEAAALTLDEALVLISEGHDLKVILVFDTSNGADVLLSKPEIKSIQQLKGKTIAAELSAVGAILLDAALAESQMSIKDVYVWGCSIDEHISCYDRADALVTFDPIKTQLMNQGARMLYDSSRIPGRIVDVLVVRKELLHSRKDTIRELLSAYFKARVYMHEHPDKSQQFIANRLNVSLEELNAIYIGLSLPNLQENLRLLRPGNKGLEHSSKQLLLLMQERKLISTELNINSIGDASLLPNAGVL